MIKCEVSRTQESKDSGACHIEVSGTTLDIVAEYALITNEMAGIVAKTLNVSKDKAFSILIASTISAIKKEDK